MKDIACTFSTNNTVEILDKARFIYLRKDREGDQSESDLLQLLINNPSKYSK